MATLIEDKMELGLVSIQRNRGQWLVEWFAFHYLVGFRKFYFYAHMCDDNTHEIIAKLSQHLDIKAFVINQPMDRVQLSAYQHACDNFMKEVDWMAFIDGDEFLFPTAERTLPETLKEFSDKPISAVGAYNINFGSSGHIEEPKGLIVENYRRCGNLDFDAHRRVKSIVKGKQQISVSACSNVFNTPLGTVDELMRPINWGYVPHLEPSYAKLRFNHYVCQSYEYYKSFKRLSGHADAGSSIVRTDEWWERFDTNEQYDSSLERYYDELKSLIAQLG